MLMDYSFALPETSGQPPSHHAAQNKRSRRVDRHKTGKVRKLKACWRCRRNHGSVSGLNPTSDASNALQSVAMIRLDSAMTVPWASDATLFPVGETILTSS